MEFIKEDTKEEKFEKDINILKEIRQRFEDNWADNEWDLSEHEIMELYRITGIEEHDWDEDNLAHFIDGMRTGFKYK